MSEEQAANKPVEEKTASSSPESEKKPAGDGSVAETGGTAPPAASDSTSQDTLKLSSEEMVKRRSRWQSSLAALRYVSSISRDNDVKIRDSDRATSIALLIVCLFALVSIVLPPLAPWRAGLVGASDVLIGVALLMYVANRFGIVTTLTPRQALLTWQLMLGSSLLGIFLAINLGLLIAWQIYNTHIDIPGA